MIQKKLVVLLTGLFAILHVGCGAEQELFFNKSLQTIIDGLTGELSEDVNTHFFPPDPDPFSDPFSTESFPSASLDSTSSPIELSEDIEASPFDIRVSLTKAITGIEGNAILTFECANESDLDFRDVPLVTTNGLVFDGMLFDDELNILLGTGEDAAPVCQSSDDEEVEEVILSINLTIQVKSEEGPVSVINLPVNGTLIIRRKM